MMEEKAIEAAKKAGVSVERVREVLKELKKFRKKIRGIWHAPGWLWIAVEQPTKLTWSGWVFSPLAPKGEYGSWYVWELEGIATPVIEPLYRWKPTKEEVERAKKMIKEVL